VYLLAKNEKESSLKQKPFTELNIFISSKSEVFISSQIIFSARNYQYIDFAELVPAYMIF
jgi:hypothetical protein